MLDLDQFRIPHATAVRFATDLVTDSETKAARTGGMLQNDTPINQLTRTKA